MLNLSWFWDTAHLSIKQQAVRILNGEAFSIGASEQAAIPGWTFEVQYSPKFLEKMRQTDLPVARDRQLLNSIWKWRRGAMRLPKDIRRCRLKRCGKFFLLTSRRKKQFCSQRCGSSNRMNEKNHAERTSDLKRVRPIWRELRKLPLADRKRRTALKAGVSLNFVTYAVRRGELRNK